MTIVEYILDPQDKPRSFHPQTVPSYITDGGYWINPDGEKMIGVGLEGSIPDSVTKFTLEGLQARQRAIHAEYPMVKFLSQYGYAPRYLSDKTAIGVSSPIEPMASFFSIIIGLYSPFPLSACCMDLKIHGFPRAARPIIIASHPVSSLIRL